jgi:hypothetical protein
MNWELSDVTERRPSAVPADKHTMSLEAAINTVKYCWMCVQQTSSMQPLRRSSVWERLKSLHSYRPTVTCSKTESRKKPRQRDAMSLPCPTPHRAHPSPLPPPDVHRGSGSIIRVRFLTTLSSKVQKRSRVSVPSMRR